MRLVVGLLLIGAATLKTVQLLTEPNATIAAPLVPAFLAFQIVAELGVGLLALVGSYWQRVRILAIALFSGFAIYSLWLLIGGATSCDCFGPVNVHPGWTFFMDLAVVLGLAISVIREQCGFVGATLPNSKILTLQCLATALLMLPAVGVATLLWRDSNTRVDTGDGISSSTSGMVILEPHQWVGKPLPLADSIDLDLSEGDWIVLLHKHDCPSCQEAVPQYEEFARDAAAEQRIAFVEVPPYGESAAHADGIHGRLSNDREWFIRTPVEIRLTNGVVMRTSTDLSTLIHTTEL